MSVSMVVVNWKVLGNELMQDRSSSPEVFYKKDVLKDFAKFTGKHLFYRALRWLLLARKIIRIFITSSLLNKIFLIVDITKIIQPWF